MHPLDWLVLACYLGLLVAIGAYFSRRQTSLSDFVKGTRRLSWVTVGIALMAALNSGNDYIQTPAIVFAFGIAYLAQVLSWFVVYPWVNYVTIPMYRRLDVYSAYEYLERRFGVGVRTVGATIFLLWRVCWMGAALYVPCLAVKGASGGTLDVTWLIIGVGSVVTLYTMLGGLQAVLWTDIAQFCVMLGGLFAALVFIVQQIPGGATEIIQTSYEAGRLSLANIGNPNLGTTDSLTRFFTTEITFVGIAMYVSLSRLASFTGDQMVIQRFQAARSAEEARSAFIVNAVTDTIWMFALGFVGLSLFAYFRHVPYPDEMQNDKVLPYYMAQVFPVGLTGAVIASVFAASLSSVDAALNSTTSIVAVDFYNRLWLGRVRPESNSPDDARHQVFVSRVINVILGIAMIAIASNIERLGELYTVLGKVFGTFFGGLFGIFLLGMMSHRTNGFGALCGAVLGLAASCFLSFFNMLGWGQELVRALLGAPAVEFLSHLSWQWPPVVGITTTLLTGYIVSRLLPVNEAGGAPMTFAEVMRVYPTEGTAPPAGH